MRKFVFSLEALLKLRRMKEEEALEAYAEAVNATLAAKGRLLDSERRERELQSLMEVARTGSFSPSMQAAYADALGVARSETVKRGKVCEEATAKEEEQLGELLTRRREAEQADRLRTRLEERHNAAEAKAEENMLEDLAMASRASRQLRKS